ncbi:MAG: NAD-dependent epimerase/dehydratase family protein, partial [Pseudarthrobacter sp.]
MRQRRPSCTPLAGIADTPSARGLKMVLRHYAIDAVIHFAGLKAVGESVAQPLAYFHNNVAGSVSLLRAMADQGVKRLVYPSCLASEAGSPESIACLHSLQHVEQMLQDVAAADVTWQIATLRIGGLELG